MPSTGTSGGVYSGVSNIINQISTLRPNAVDTLKIFERKYGDVEFMNALFHKSITKKPVNDYKFVRGEREEELVRITLLSASVSIDASTMSFTVSDTHANQLDIGMMLQNTNCDFNGITAGSYANPALIGSVRQAEIAEIISKTLSAPHVYTIVVRRGHVLRDITMVDGTNTTVLWQTTHTVLKANYVAHDSEEYHIPFDVNPKPFYNYCGDFRKTVGATERKRNVKQWAEEDGTMKAQTARKFDSLLKDMERAFLYQSYSFDDTQAGRERTASRSMLEIIPAANWLDVNAATIHALNAQLSFFSEQGQSTDKRILVGTRTFIERFHSLFTDHLIQEPLYGDLNLGWTVPTYRDNLGGRYQLLHSYEMGRTAWWDNRAIVINMSAVNYAYFVGKEGSFDLYLDKGPEGKGLQDNGSKDLIYEWRACCGLDVMAWDYHGVLTLNF